MSTQSADRTGRWRQKQRTREALVSSARDLVTLGETPTVERAAERAGISRTTAYRYFANQRALLLAAHPETGTTSLLPPDASDDPVARLDAVVARFTQLISDTEPQQRTMLRMALDPLEGHAELPLRQGRAIGWITEALEPLRGALADAQVHRLALAIRSAIGIEARVWLTDVAGLSDDDAMAVMRWSARALLAAALAGQVPPDGGDRRTTQAGSRARPTPAAATLTRRGP
jgi:AcrR family transcriptional regulator